MEPTVPIEGSEVGVNDDSLMNIALQIIRA